MQQKRALLCRLDHSRGSSRWHLLCPYRYLNKTQWMKQDTPKQHKVYLLLGSS